MLLAAKINEIYTTGSKLLKMHHGNVYGTCGGNKSVLNTMPMKKQKRILKQLEKIYSKNETQFSRADQLLFKLLIYKLSKRERIVLTVFCMKLLKWLISFICADSRPGSFLFYHAPETNHRQCAYQAASAPAR